jgi:hypothetical protein
VANIARSIHSANPSKISSAAYYGRYAGKAKTSRCKSRSTSKRTISLIKSRPRFPGVKKEDINIQIDRNQVCSIRAESKREKEVKEKGKVVRSERYYGSLFRSFSLGHDVDQAGASAKYTDGILELTLPKKVTSKTRKLTNQ